MRKDTKLSILIVNDHFLIRVGLRQILSTEYRDIAFGEAATAAEALTHIKAQPWHLIILASSLSGEDGSSVLREIHIRSPLSPVLILSIHPDSQSSSRALQFGAAGYVSKCCSRSDLVKAVKNAIDGKLHFNESAQARVRGSTVSNAQKPAARHTTLSNREYKVFLAFATGKRTSEVAAELNLSAKTISTYKRRALNKLGITSTADLVRYVIENRLS